MNKIENYIVSAWLEISNSLENNFDKLTDLEVYNVLKDWMTFVKKCNDSRVQVLYEKYLMYFEPYDLNNYKFDQRWYNLLDLVRFDIINFHQLSVINLIPQCRDLLWELLVFKSNKDCKNGDDELRVMTDSQHLNFYFCCDKCGYIETFNSVELYSPILNLEPIFPTEVSLLSLKPSAFQKNI